MADFVKLWEYITDWLALTDCLKLTNPFRKLEATGENLLKTDILNYLFLVENSTVSTLQQIKVDLKFSTILERLSSNFSFKIVKDHKQILRLFYIYSIRWEKCKTNRCFFTISWQRQIVPTFLFFAVHSCYVIVTWIKCLIH